MLGKAAVAMWWEIAPEMQAEFEDWHTHEHMPERLGIPGFLRGTRGLALSGEPSYFVLYEASELATLTGAAYLQRLNNPTPWSRAMMPHHRHMVRSLCTVRASFGRGVAYALATLRLSPSAGQADALSAWLSEHALRELPQQKGLTGAHLLVSAPLGGAPPTAEQKIRGRDASADWVVVLCGYDAQALARVLHEELHAEALVRRGAAPAMSVGLYRVAFCLTSSDMER